MVATSKVRLEDKYNLLVDYPKESPLFKSIFDEEAITIDILPVYMALHHRAIPKWVERDYDQEHIDKIIILMKRWNFF